MRKAGNLHLHEFVGLRVRVVSSTNRCMVGLEGTVLYETKNTIVIERNGEVKVLPKHGTRFSFLLGGEGVVLDGDMIRFRPHERPKKLWSRSRRRRYGNEGYRHRR
jgi:ribonuclease P protein subunit POP4